MIQGYPDRLSVAPGETLTLHLATDHPELRVAIYRQGVDLALQHDYGWQPTRTVGIADGPPDAAWEWDGSTWTSLEPAFPPPDAVVQYQSTTVDGTGTFSFG